MNNLYTNQVYTVKSLVVLFKTFIPGYVTISNLVWMIYKKYIRNPARKLALLEKETLQVLFHNCSICESFVTQQTTSVNFSHIHLNMLRSMIANAVVILWLKSSKSRGIRNTNIRSLI